MRWSRLLLMLIVSAVPAGAQARDAAQRARVPIPYRTYVAINPILVPFDIGSIEIENGIAQGITVGGAASYTDLSGDRYVSADVKARYYPSEVVLRGFSLGLSAGYLRFEPEPEVLPRDRLSAPTIGVVTDYNWMLGGSGRFIVGVGAAAKRVLASASERDRVGMGQAYVTTRFVVGLAF